MSERLLTGWGRTAPTRARVHAPRDGAEVRGALASAGRRGVLARGLGRSYGDAAQNAGGDVLEMTALDAIRSIDAHAGTVTADAGVSFDRLLAELVPRGWFLPVVPGTRSVTLGGAIASDVHGKNHHRDGALGRHVRSLELERADGERVTLGPDADPAALAATAGGMGLTGVVVQATLSLIPISTSRIAAEVERAADIDEVMARMSSGDDGFRYSVAWVDALASGRSLGRSVLQRGDHASVDELAGPERSAALARRAPRSLPAPWMPAGGLRRGSLRVFNELYFRRAPERPRRIVTDLDPFFFPLDALRDWNRMYGAGGLLQYQFVVPFGREDVVRSALERLGRAPAPAVLAVIKRFGAGAGPLSFPMPGWTLAVDLPAGVPGLAPILAALDVLVAEAGGRVYLAKDARVHPEVFAAMYPRLGEWRETRARLDPAGTMRSDLARRLDLVRER